MPADSISASTLRVFRKYNNESVELIIVLVARIGFNFFWSIEFQYTVKNLYCPDKTRLSTYQSRDDFNRLARVANMIGI